MELTLEDAIRILRRYTGKQATFTLLEEDGGRCAMGVLGGESLELRRDHVFLDGIEVREEDVGALYNLTRSQSNQIVDWNDINRHTFREIADKMEAWL